MPDADDVHNQPIIEHLIQNPGRADADPVDGVFSAECDATARQWLVGQQVKGSSDALLIAAGQLPEVRVARSANAARAASTCADSKLNFESVIADRGRSHR